MGRTPMEPNEIKPTAIRGLLSGPLARTPGSGPPLSLVKNLGGNKGGKRFRVGVCFDFVGSSARAEGPHGGASYVQMSGRCQIDPHQVKVEHANSRRVHDKVPPHATIFQRLRDVAERLVERGYHALEAVTVTGSQPRRPPAIFCVTDHGRKLSFPRVRVKHVRMKGPRVFTA